MSKESIVMVLLFSLIALFFIMVMIIEDTLKEISKGTFKLDVLMKRLKGGIKCKKLKQK